MSEQDSWLDPNNLVIQDFVLPDTYYDFSGGSTRRTLLTMDYTETIVYGEDPDILDVFPQDAESVLADTELYATSHLEDKVVIKTLSIDPNAFLISLNTQERLVLFLHLGVGKARRLTVEQVAKELHISVEEVTQTIEDIKRKYQEQQNDSED